MLTKLSWRRQQLMKLSKFRDHGNLASCLEVVLLTGPCPSSDLAGLRKPLLKFCVKSLSGMDRTKLDEPKGSKRLPWVENSVLRNHIFVILCRLAAQYLASRAGLQAFSKNLSFKITISSLLFTTSQMVRGSRCCHRATGQSWVLHRRGHGHER